MIKVTGTARVRCDFVVELDMTEEEFENLSTRQQDEVLENAINWRDAFESSVTDEIDVWEVE